MVRAAEPLGIPIRVGIHTGEVEFIAGNVRGVAVHAAARVLSVAGPSEVVVSDTTNGLLEGSGLGSRTPGCTPFKGLSGQRRLFRLTKT